MPKKNYTHLFEEDHIIDNEDIILKQVRQPKTKIRSIEPNLYVDIDGAYYIRFQYNRKTWERPLLATTLKAARDEKYQFILDIKKESNGIQIEKKIPTISQAIDLWKKGKKGTVTDNYIRDGGRILHRIFDKPMGHFKVDKISTALLRRVIREYHNKSYIKGGAVRMHTPRTTNTLIMAVKSLFTWLEEDEYIRVSPARRLKTYEEPEFKRNVVQLVDFEQFLNEVDKLNHIHISFMMRAMILLGLRSCEAVNMKWSNWDQQNHYYTPGMHGLTKGKEAKSLKIPMAMRYWFEMAKKQDKKSLIYIYINHETNLPYNTKVLRWHLNKLSKAMGQKLSPHSLRASYITALSHDHDLPTCSELARHADIATTMLYINVDQKRMDEAVLDTFSNLA